MERRWGLQMIIDYTETFAEYVMETEISQGQGRNFLALIPLDDYIERADGKKSKWELMYRWLSEDCLDPKDQSWACVLGSESIFPTDSEIEHVLKDLETNPNFSLFDHFYLF